jgi:hypothetical protein
LSYKDNKLTTFAKLKNFLEEIFTMNFEKEKKNNTKKQLAACDVGRKEGKETP